MSEPHTPYGTSLPNLGEQIRLWRMARNLTQAALEERAGLSHNAVSRIECGSVSPRLDTIERIAQALDVSVGQLQFQQPTSVASSPSPLYGMDEHLSELVQALNRLPEGKRIKMIQTFMALARMTAGEVDA